MLTEVSELAGGFNKLSGPNQYSICKVLFGVLALGINQGKYRFAFESCFLRHLSLDLD